MNNFTNPYYTLTRIACAVCNNPNGRIVYLIYKTLEGDYWFKCADIDCFEHRPAKTMNARFNSFIFWEQTSVLAIRLFVEKNNRRDIEYKKRFDNVHKLS